MPGAPSVTVAVPVKDRREQMLRCLDALLAQDHPDYEVLVLDNESSDGTAEACRERAAGARVPVRVEVVPGTVGAVRNAAVRMARSELVAFTDSDCIPAPGWLSGGIAAFESPERLGIVTGVTLPEDPPPHGAWPATIEVTGPTMRFESCNVFFRREAFLESGGFDEDVGHFWEDTAAGFAILRAGWERGFAPDALVYHDVTYPGWRWHLKRAQRQRNLAKVLRAYPEIRSQLLWKRMFLRPRNALVAAALGGVALAPVTAWSLLAAAPYAWFRRPRRAPHPVYLLSIGQLVAYDVAMVVGVVRGAVRYRRIVF
jgi:GT2 family glycosyltransferase